MRPRRVLAGPDMAEIFDRAVEERALAVLTVQSDSQWLTFKSRFLERDPRGRFFVLDHLPNGDHTPPSIIPGQCLGVSFRQKSRKLLFATVAEAIGRFHLDDRTVIPAVRYRWPDSMTEMQRRAYYRTRVPDDTTLLVSVWPGGIAARGNAQKTPLQVTTGELADLSCGGALLRLHLPTPPNWVDGQTLGLEMQLPDGRTPILTDARYRGVRLTAGGALTAAIQFVGLELTPDGRTTLQRLANSVQRLYRLNLASGRIGNTRKFII